ncbi:serine-rich adhesin for platelets-like isoform X2 [Acropora muricata]|uniref:serine-rich adhesin for platelets-like isoform X2 n=1 Tax=Acropora muricata TaxID=159855 RepID=UPI0034E50A25
MRSTGQGGLLKTIRPEMFFDFQTAAAQGEWKKGASNEDTAEIPIHEKREQSVSPSSSCSVKGPTNKSAASTQASGKSKKLSSMESLITFAEATNGSKRESATTVTKEKREQSLSPSNGCSVQRSTNTNRPCSQALGEKKEFSWIKTRITFFEARNGSKRDSENTFTKEKGEESLSVSSGCSVQGPTSKSAPGTQASSESKEFSSEESLITFPKATNGSKRESATAVTKEKQEQSLSPSSGCSVQGPANKSAPRTQASGESKELLSKGSLITFPEATNASKRKSATTVTNEKQEQSLSPSSGCSVQGPTKTNRPSTQASGERREFSWIKTRITFFEATNDKKTKKKDSENTFTKEKGEESLSASKDCSVQDQTNKSAPSTQASSKSKELSSRESLITFAEATNGSKRESAITVTKEKREQSVSPSSGCSVPGPRNITAPSTQAHGKSKELLSKGSLITFPGGKNGSKRKSATTVTNEKREQSLSPSSGFSVQGPTKTNRPSTEAFGERRELSWIKTRITFFEATNGSKRDSENTFPKEKGEESLSASKDCSVQDQTNISAPSTQAPGKSKELLSKGSLITFPAAKNGSKRKSATTVTDEQRKQSLSPSSGCSVQGSTKTNRPSTQAFGERREFSWIKRRITFFEATNGSKKDSENTFTKEKGEESLSASKDCSVQDQTNKSAPSTQASSKSKELSSRESLITFAEATNGSKRESAITVTKEKREQSVSPSSGCSVPGPRNISAPSTQAHGKSKELLSKGSLITFPGAKNGSKRKSATTVTNEKQEQSLSPSSGCSVQGPTKTNRPSTQASGKSKELVSRGSLITFPEATNGSKRESATTFTKEKREQSLSPSSGCSVQGPTKTNRPSTQASGKSKELVSRGSLITFPEATNGSKRESATTFTNEKREQSLSPSSGCSVQGPTKTNRPSTQASGKSKELVSRGSLITFPEATNGSKRKSATTFTKEKREQSLSPSSGCSVQGPTKTNRPSTQASGKSKELVSRGSLITFPEATNGSKRKSATTFTKEKREQSLSPSSSCSVPDPRNISAPSTQAPGTKEKWEESKQGHIRGDNPDAPICKDFLLGNCKKGSKCHGHHYTLPFQWQYNSYGEWITFNDGDNEKFEKLYCDVNVDKTQVTQISVALHEEHSNRLLESCDGTVLLDEKILIMKNSSATLVTLRRLSTVSYVYDPVDTTATLWTWYWMDEHGYWKEYDLDHTGTDLQQALENAFLRKSPGGIHFRIAYRDYKINFSPESDMRQENVRYGTKRKVRRRPREFVTGNDIKLLKRPESMLSAEQTKAKDSHLPSNWSSMPSETQYKRVCLSCFSEEFKDVEKLFRKSMKRSVEILKIERVQNPFMWEKYQRMKENMLASKKTINEKRLFHGTSQDAVGSICKQNFDWRLHGKNATKYGEGSYFALNSWKSDTYATRNNKLSKFMFVAKVLVGSYTVGHSSDRRPPRKDPRNPESDLYDSCVDDTSSPSIFVLFDTDQFYPEYIIEYYVFQ